MGFVVGEVDSKILGDTSGNKAEVTASKAVLVDLSASADSVIQIIGPSGNIADVNASNELRVVNDPLEPPAGADFVSRIDDSTINSAIDDIYTITTGKTLKIRRLSGGAESSTSGHVIDLYEDPNGTLSPLNLIENVYVNGSSDQKIFEESLIGDGTRRIVMRRSAFVGGNYRVTARWDGFEETT
jgi:hypothetical protein